MRISGKPYIRSNFLIMSEVLYPNFWRPRDSQGALQDAWRAPTAVQNLFRNSLPLNPKKVVSLWEDWKTFLTWLQSVSSVELHIEADVIDDVGMLFYVAPPGDTPYAMNLGDFLDLLTEGNFTVSPYKVEEVVPFLEEIFQRIHIYFETLNFSPRDHLDHIEDGTWSLDSLGERVFVSWDYFYSISTYDTEEEGMTASPEMVLDWHPHARLIDLAALYLEQTYRDSIKKYDESTPVEILRYSYKTRKTHIIRLSYGELERACLTEIIEKHPLFRNFDDRAEIISAYLDRALSREVEDSRVLPFPAK